MCDGFTGELGHTGDIWRYLVSGVLTAHSPVIQDNRRGIDKTLLDTRTNGRNMPATSAQKAVAAPKALINDVR